MSERVPDAPELGEVISFEEYLQRYDSVEGIRAEWTPKGVEISHMTVTDQPIFAKTVTPAAPDEMISFEEYLQRYDSVEGVHTEWTPRKVEVYTISNNTVHQEIIGWLYLLFRLFLDRHQLGRVLLAGVHMIWHKVQPARQPDLLIILNDKLDRIQSTYFDGAADAVVEVVSPESDSRDHGEKFVEHEAAGVREYYLCDPTRQVLDVFILGGDGRYHRAVPDAEGRIASAVLPGLAFDPALLWGDPLPDVLAILALVQGMGAE